ncbi:MmcQ/YjbR family DNA-binding protein [Nocardioides astragali]|uniref:MmcQ/YjbR family DNA-binding protein n=1 Tax=Nocardioides astragali TaxID=1776736 RepID=A0ABW2NBJ8_9ACTN|nr:MmcQ/YjbR family DNA-binding protein [Nocardioides astragali]
MSDDEALEAAAWRTATPLAGVTRGPYFGPGYEVFKVIGKVFMMTTDVPGRMVVTLKCDPHDALALRTEFPSIVSGYHMNKRHWISIGTGAGITEGLVSELVTNAYLLVVDSLPRRLRPLEPRRP